MACAAGVLASQPDLFFLSSALSLTGFGDQLPSPNLPVTVFAPTNNAILGLLNYLSTSAAPCPHCCAPGKSTTDSEHMGQPQYMCLLFHKVSCYGGCDMILSRQKVAVICHLMHGSVIGL